MAVKEIDGHKIYQAFSKGAETVIAQRKKLNSLNFYPVPDNDTGSNLSLTLKGLLDDAHSHPSAYHALASISEDTLRSARGNSGLIFAQFISGLHTGMKNNHHIRPTDMAAMTRSAVKRVYGAVEHPVEGTMLTVIREWSAAVEAASRLTSDFHHLLESAFESAKQSLKRTRTTLKENRTHRTVDAGALGFVYFLEGMLNIFTKQDTRGISSVDNTVHIPKADNTASHAHSIYRFCFNAYVQTEESRDELTDMLHGYGDSLIIIGEKKRFRIHIHTEDPAAVMLKLSEKCSIMEHDADNMHIQESVAAKHRKTLIITDSLADLPENSKERLMIPTMPVSLIADGVEFLDKVTVTPETLPGLIDRSDSFPGSTQVSYDNVKNSLLYYAEHTDAIIIPSVSAGLSGTFNVLKKAAAEAERETGTAIHVIDTRLNSGAQGLVVQQAGEESDAGLSPEEIMRNIETRSEKTKIFVAMDTLRNMVRGGRISRFKGFMARLINMKPIVSLDKDGKGFIAGKAFSKKKAVKKIMNIVKSARIRKFCVVHSSAEKEAHLIARELESSTGLKAEYVTEISPVITLNSGKGSVAVCFEEY